MKMREAAMVRQWLADAGFTIDAMLTDSRHCYVVTLARKP